MQQTPEGGRARTALRAAWLSPTPSPRGVSDEVTECVGQGLPVRRHQRASGSTGGYRLGSNTGQRCCLKADPPCSPMSDDCEGDWTAPSSWGVYLQGPKSRPAFWDPMRFHPLLLAVFLDGSKRAEL